MLQDIGEVSPAFESDLEECIGINGHQGTV